MKKTSKFLILLLVSLVVVYTVLVGKVNAAETTTIDYDGYTEIESSITTNKENTTTENTTKTENKTTTTDNKTNTTKKEETTANTAHPQTGKYDYVMFLTIGGVVLSIVFFAIIKIKKYSY